MHLSITKKISSIKQSRNSSNPNIKTCEKIIELLASEHPKKQKDGEKLIEAMLEHRINKTKDGLFSRIEMSKENTIIEFDKLLTSIETNIYGKDLLKLVSNTLVPRDLSIDFKNFLCGYDCEGKELEYKKRIAIYSALSNIIQKDQNKHIKEFLDGNKILDKYPNEYKVQSNKDNNPITLEQNNANLLINSQLEIISSFSIKCCNESEIKIIEYLLDCKLLSYSQPMDLHHTIDRAIKSLGQMILNYFIKAGDLKNQLLARMKSKQIQRTKGHDEIFVKLFGMTFEGFLVFINSDIRDVDEFLENKHKSLPNQNILRNKKRTDIIGYQPKLEHKVEDIKPANDNSSVLVEQFYSTSNVSVAFKVQGFKTYSSANPKLSDSNCQPELLDDDLVEIKPHVPDYDEVIFSSSEGEIPQNDYDALDVSLSSVLRSEVTAEASDKSDVIQDAVGINHNCVTIKFKQKLANKEFYINLDTLGAYRESNEDTLPDAQILLDGILKANGNTNNVFDIRFLKCFGHDKEIYDAHKDVMTKAFTEKISDSKFYHQLWLNSFGNTGPMAAIVGPDPDFELANSYLQQNLLSAKIDEILTKPLVDVQNLLLECIKDNGFRKIGRSRTMFALIVILFAALPEENKPNLLCGCMSAKDRTMAFIFCALVIGTIFFHRVFNNGGENPVKVSDFFDPEKGRFVKGCLTEEELNLVKAMLNNPILYNILSKLGIGEYNNKNLYIVTEMLENYPELHELIIKAALIDTKA
ncbi:MAG: hypothetical protein ACK5Z5_01390 [Neisseriaceae bacterium]